MIALIDYGAGNLTSVRKALAFLGVAVKLSRAPADLDGTRAMIVPGVGHFGATAALTDEWRRAILSAVEEGRPLLGICLGMQWLFDDSAEAPDLRGLGLIPGRCELIGSGALGPAEPARTPAGGEPGTAGRLKVPHVGWNDLLVRRQSRLLDGIQDGDQAYFTHSYAAPVTPECVAATAHGDTFSSVVEGDRIFGVQFHPEKSGAVGLRVLRNFLDAVQTHHRLS